MASPGIVSLSEGGASSGSGIAFLAVTLPSGGTADDEYLVIIAKGSVACSVEPLADWTELLDENVANGLAILRYTGAGIPSDPTFETDFLSRSVWGSYLISGADKAITPEVGVTATGTSTTPNPPSRAVTGGPKDILAIVCFAGAGEVADTDILVTTFPTGSGAGIEKTGGTLGTNLGGILGAAGIPALASSSIDPPTFLQNASRAWRAQTIVFHGVSAQPKNKFFPFI